jgi:hypothetical protein
MKRRLTLILEDAESFELCRILLDRDADVREGKVAGSCKKATTRRLLRRLCAS